MQRSAIPARRNLLIRLPRLLQRVILRQRNHATQLRIEPLYAADINLRQPLRRDLPAFDPTRKLRDCRKCDVLFVCRQCSRPDRAADKHIRRRIALHPRQHRIPQRRRSHVLFDCQLLRSRPPLVQRSHLHPPVLRRLGAVRRSHLHLHQLLRLGKGRGRYLRPHRRSRAERRRSTGGRIRGRRFL